MFFVRFFRFFTACLVSIWLTACVSYTPPTDFNRSEAVKARVNLALAYLEAQDFAKAKENIDRAMTHDSQDYLPYSVLAYYYQKLGDTEYAEKSYQDAIALSRKQSKTQQPLPDVLNNYGTFLCEQGLFKQAYQQFEQALTKEQSYYHQADSWENIALCAKKAQDFERFEQAWQQLYSLEPERAKALH